ncbi:30S ribosomal protein S6 [Williamsoniiplasma luminosum]|uniref:Small ribosomal subunit protein bS6 n=1 Tax=Williamsoniiplasma luminosum TaxID=214888 RepID=A0A2K8NUM8_9MOLU|nr:30S ribosomal protein S6 [Williamsoniiplasma luminosum]ATZ16868.1 30S ribosomal protein S6 [Williamsoniiplasma luminosum]AVP49539.1 MAG: 30S ribosomal protein S6 [Williamsoniiplasma luminosum]
MKRKYEIMYILDQDVKDTQEVINKLNGILTSEGKIIESSEWGLMNFAYEINHKKKGYYVVVIVETTSSAVAEFERVTGIDKNVVRTLVLNTENLQNYEQTTKMSKTDMTKYEEERREKRDFKKPFVKREWNKDNKDFNKDRGEYKPRFNKDFSGPRADKPAGLAKPADEKSSSEDSHAYVVRMQEKYAAELKKHEEADRLEREAHEKALAAATEEADKEKIIKARAEAKAKKAQMSTEERAKLDGSDAITELRSELQKHANSLRALAPESEAKIHQANLRDMTKKELIKYMKSVATKLNK